MTMTLPFTEIQQWAADADARSARFRRGAFPLAEMPDHMVQRIREQVEADHKPPYWLDLGLAQIPSRGWIEWHWQRGIDPGARRPAIPAWMRAAVLDRDGYVCQLCSGDVEPDDVHMDHVKPFSKGGATTVANLQVAHSRCNIRKGART